MKHYGEGFQVAYVRHVDEETGELDEEWRLKCDVCGNHIMGTNDPGHFERGAMKDFVANHRSWCYDGAPRRIPYESI